MSFEQQAKTAQSSNRYSIAAAVITAVAFFAVFNLSDSPALRLIAIVALLLSAIALMGTTMWVFILRGERKKLQRAQKMAIEPED